MKRSRRCADNSCGDCSWCGYQEEDDEIFRPYKSPEPDEIDTSDDDEWVDYLSGRYKQ